MTISETNTVSIYRSLSNPFANDASDRQRHVTFKCCPETSDVLEWLFEATNAPESFLNEEQLFVRKVFADASMHSLCNGDVVSVNDTFYKCKPIGWEKVKNANDDVEY
jgi:hypothetical protein